MIKKEVAIRSILFVCLLMAMISCSSDSLNDEAENNRIIAEDIVKQSIEAHGGWDKWTSMKSISYSKTITLFDSSGTKESTITQFHSYHLKPALSGVIWWLDDLDTIIIAYANGVGVQSINSIADQAPHAKIAATKSFFSSFYVLFQPFKLIDEGTSLSYVGDDILEDGTEVSVVKPLYKGAKEGDDSWWYYFDKKTNKLVANMVNHPPTYSLIINLKQNDDTGILFNTYRKSYFVDELRYVDYLRAEYFYDNFRVEYLNKPNT